MACIFRLLRSSPQSLFVLQLAIKRLLDACGFYRFVWHRALFDLALYVILLGVVTAAGAVICRSHEIVDVKSGDASDEEAFRLYSAARCSRSSSVLVAIAVGWQLWSYYMLEPWTRDGRVRADVVSVAADVSGLISDVFVHDNEKVSKGQPLFRIDQRRFQYALDQAKADVASHQTTLDQAKRDLARSKSLTIVADHRRSRSSSAAGGRRRAGPVR